MIAHIQSWKTVCAIHRQIINAHTCGALRTHVRFAVGWGDGGGGGGKFSYKSHSIDTETDTIFQFNSFTISPLPLRPPISRSIIYGKRRRTRAHLPRCVGIQHEQRTSVWLLESNTKLDDAQRAKLNESDKMNWTWGGMNETQWIDDDCECPSFFFFFIWKAHREYTHATLVMWNCAIKRSNLQYWHTKLKRFLCTHIQTRALARSLAS